MALKEEKRSFNFLAQFCWGNRKFYCWSESIFTQETTPSVKYTAGLPDGESKLKEKIKVNSEK